VADTFTQEVTILRRVTEHKHRHLVSVVGSYTDPDDFAILFSPLADMNLDEYLRELGATEDLKTWFGCLATAIDFLHKLRIR
jgi:serine/threonine protein kinase